MLAMIALVATSCKKDKSQTELITDGAWKTTAITVNPPFNFYGTQVTDWFSQLEDCSRDDLWIFKDNGKVDYDEGGTKCSNDDPQTIVSDWAFNSDETIVSITDADGYVESYNITELSEDDMTWTSTFVDDNLTYTMTARFEH